MAMIKANHIQTEPHYFGLTKQYIQSAGFYLKQQHGLCWCNNLNSSQGQLADVGDSLDCPPSRKYGNKFTKDDSLTVSPKAAGKKKPDERGKEEENQSNVDRLQTVMDSCDSQPCLSSLSDSTE